MSYCQGGRGLLPRWEAELLPRWEAGHVVLKMKIMAGPPAPPRTRPAPITAPDAGPFARTATQRRMHMQTQMPDWPEFKRSHPGQMLDVKMAAAVAVREMRAAED